MGVQAHVDSLPDRLANHTHFLLHCHYGNVMEVRKMAQKRKATHSEREAEVARKLGLRFTKDAPKGATNESIGKANARMETRKKPAKRK